MKLSYLICIQLLVFGIIPNVTQGEQDMLARGFRGRPMPIEGGESFRPPVDNPERFQRDLTPEERVMRRDAVLEEPLLDEPYIDPDYVPPPDENGVNMDNAGDSNGQNSDFDSDDDQDFDKP